MSTIDSVAQQLQKDMERVASKSAMDSLASNRTVEVTWESVEHNALGVSIILLMALISCGVVAFVTFMKTSQTTWSRFRRPTPAPYKFRYTLLPIVLSFCSLAVSVILVLLKTSKNVSSMEMVGYAITLLPMMLWSPIAAQVGDLSLAFLDAVASVGCLGYLSTKYGEIVEVSAYGTMFALLVHAWLAITSFRMLYESEMKDMLAQSGVLPAGGATGSKPASGPSARGAARRFGKH